MPSLLSKYRSKKRDSSADEARSNHNKGASDSSFDSNAQSPQGVGSTRGLNSPFLGEDKRASSQKAQKAGDAQPPSAGSQEHPGPGKKATKPPGNPNYPGRGPPQQVPQGPQGPQAPQGPQGSQGSQFQGSQGSQGPQGSHAPQGPHGPARPQIPSQGPQGLPAPPAGPNQRSQRPQGTPPLQGTPASHGTPGSNGPPVSFGTPSSKQPAGIPPLSRQAHDPPQSVPTTPSHALPVQGERIERYSPKQDRQDPWAEWQIRRACPSARFGHSANNVAARDGELLIMGGIRDMDILDDLWIIDTNSLSGYQVKTEGPYVGPRVGHAALTLGNAYIMMGGDTKIKESDPLDDNLYLLNTSTFKWTIAEPAGPRPCGRYGHSICNIGVHIYVFGGQVDDLFFDDMWMFDLNNLRPPNARWEKIEPRTAPPPPRTNHTVVTYDEKIYLFGGANGDLWYSDTWCFDPATTSWTQLECTGYVPAPCQGHAATIVGDVMYVFGGMSSQGLLIGQLFALKLTTRKWYTFQNLGAGPSPRSGHSLTAFDNDKIIVWGGTDQSNTAFVLDVSRISYPPENEAVVDSEYEQQQQQQQQHHANTSVEESAQSPQLEEPTLAPGAGPVIADPTDRQVDTHERSTPAARNSVIYSRASWSPRRRSRMSQPFDDQADIPQNVEEVENEDSIAHDNSYSYDRSDDFNKSLEHNRMNRDRAEMETGFLGQEDQSRAVPEVLPAKVPDTPPTKDVPNKSRSSTIAGAVAGAAGAIGAIGTGLFGMNSADKSAPQEEGPHGVTNEMPGAWSQTRAEYDSDSSEPQIPGINTDAKSISSVASNGSANHTTQHTLDRLNDYDNSYEDALQQGGYPHNGGSSTGIMVPPSVNSLNQSTSSMVTAPYPDTSQWAETKRFSSDADSADQYSEGIAPVDRSVMGTEAPVQPPFQVQTSTGAFNSPDMSNPSKVSERNDFSGVAKAGAAIAGTAGIVGLAASKSENSPTMDANATGKSSSPVHQLNAQTRSISTAQDAYTPGSGVAAGAPVSHGTVDKEVLKKLETEFAQVKIDMQKQSQEANQRIKQLEQERDQALSKLAAGTADQSIDNFKQKHVATQRELLSTKETHQSLAHEHSKLQAQHSDLSASSEHLTNTMDQHVRALDAVNKAYEKLRISSETLQQEADTLRTENADLKQRVAELEKQAAENSHHADRAVELEKQLGTVREAHEASNDALNQHLTQLVGHWDKYHQSFQESKSKPTDRSVAPEDVDHYNTLYEQQKTAHESTQKELDAAYAQISQFREAQKALPSIDTVKGQHKEELDILEKEHSSKVSKLIGDHESTLHEVQAKYQGQIDALQKQFSDLEREYNDSLDHFKSQRVALERTREELSRVKEANNKLEEELQDTKLQIQDPDVSTASTASNRHAEVMVRGFKAKIMVLEEERDELRQKLSKLKEAALANNF